MVATIGVAVLMASSSTRLSGSCQTDGATSTPARRIRVQPYPTSTLSTTICASATTAGEAHSLWSARMASVCRTGWASCMGPVSACAHWSVESGDSIPGKSTTSHALQHTREGRA